MAMIILVDDDKELLESNLLYLKMKMSNKNFVSFSDPAHAIKFIETIAFGERKTIDLVVTDYHMPKINGVQLANMVRAVFPSVPILFHSGSYAKEMGGFNNSGFIKKGGEMNDLVEEINFLLGENR